MTVRREQVMDAVLHLLASTIVTNFAGDTALGSPTLSNLSTTTGFFVGLPVFGPGIPAGAVINSFDAGLSQATLSENAKADGTAVALRTGFQTIGRRLKLWSDVSAQPALFLRHTGDIYASQFSQIQRTMRIEVWIYANGGKNPNAIPGKVLNDLVDAVESALDLNNLLSGRQTLNGLVTRCWIEGDSEHDPGDIDSQAKAIIPIRVLVP